jgi:hypothetical protein
MIEEVDSLGRRIVRTRNIRSRLPVTPISWRADAACNPNTHPEVDPRWQWADTDMLLPYCKVCPVVGDCLAEQRVLRVDGVWGGRIFTMTNGGRTREVA